MPYIRKIQFVGGAFVALDRAGSIWRWGGIRHEMLDETSNSEFNAFWFGVSGTEYSQKKYVFPKRVYGIDRIVKVTKDGRYYLSEDGQVFFLLEKEYQEKIEEYAEKTLWNNFYKMKLPEKAVDISGAIALLESGRLHRLIDVEVGAWKIKNQLLLENVGPVQYIDNISGVIHLSNNTAITQAGHVYRWGRIYGSGSGLDYVGMQSDVPVNIETLNEEVAFFNESVIVLSGGKIIFLGRDSIYVSLFSESKLKARFLSGPFELRKIIDFQTSYHSINGLTR